MSGQPPIGSTVRDPRGWLFRVDGYHPDGTAFIWGLQKSINPPSGMGPGGPMGPFMVNPEGFRRYIVHNDGSVK